MRMNIVLIIILIGMVIISRLIFSALENNETKISVEENSYQQEKVDHSSPVLELMCTDGIYQIEAKKYRAALGLAWTLGCLIGFLVSILVLDRFFYKIVMKKYFNELTQKYQQILRGRGLPRMEDEDNN